MGDRVKHRRGSCAQGLVILCLLALGVLAASAARADGGAGVSQGQEYHRFKQYVRWSE